MTDTEPKVKKPQTKSDLPGLGEKRQAIHELMVGGQASSLIVTNSADEETIRERETGDTEKKKTKEALRHLLMDQIINQQLKEAQKLRDLLRTQLDILNERIREDKERLEKIIEFKQAIKRIRQQLQKTGQVEFDENGELKDKRAEAAIWEYEKTYGIKIDRENLSDELLLHILKDFEEQGQEHKDRIDEGTKEQAYVRDQLDDIEKVIDALERGYPETQSDAIDKLSEMQKKAVLRKGVSQDVAKENIEKEGYTKKQAERSAFEFKFPPVNEAFNKSAVPQEAKAQDENEVKTASPRAPVPGGRIF